MQNEKQPIQQFLERRYASRRPVSLKLPAWVDGQEQVLGVRDLSQTGFLAEATPPLRIDQVVELELPHEGRKKATVVWAGEELAGCTFVGSISRASYSAALLKSQILHPQGANQEQAAEAITVAEDDPVEKLPMGLRVAVMVIGGALAWVPVLAIAYWLFG
ncbi:MAG: PilZ domain-containing protein [Altererythrobacter sp.]|nr:PilZ domain-containing protein [Altererythrobacter sp.]OJU58701.1 MAG: hypothetical protein BGO08_06705 [Altererythrobacter sp. 66-12]